MIIAARRLSDYEIPFPVSILQERGDEVAVVVKSPVELMGYIVREKVIGIGSKRRVRYLRMNTVVTTEQPATGHKVKSRLPVAEDNRTVILDGRTYQHHRAHCMAMMSVRWA